jgi:hypothetical protein
MNMKAVFSLLAAASLALSGTAFAAGGKTYQVTGPVLEVTDTMIAVQKGKDRWEINRDANTKVTGDLKVGEKVTITYTMSATEVEVNPEGCKGRRQSAGAENIGAQLNAGVFAASILRRRGGNGCSRANYSRAAATAVHRVCERFAGLLGCWQRAFAP